MFDLNSFILNILHPPVLFFMLGMLAVLVRSDLEIPPQIGKFLALYLLFDIGIKGEQELYHSGFNPVMIKTLATCLLFSILIPIVAYKILRLKLNNANAAAIAATYGSVSAVTFATAVSFLEAKAISYGGFMVAGMALMETPAIIAGLFLYGLNRKHTGKHQEAGGDKPKSKRLILHEAMFNGSVFLLLGSLLIGILSGPVGTEELKPFVVDIFKGMLCFYMLDMGLIAAQRLQELKKSGLFLISFALVYPLVAAAVGILVASLLHLEIGNALLLTILFTSASYIAVPAAMRTAIPQANLSLLLPMSLGITFTFNIIVGIPLYFYLLSHFLKG